MQLHKTIRFKGRFCFLMAINFGLRISSKKEVKGEKEKNEQWCTVLICRLGLKQKLPPLAQYNNS